MKCLKKFSRIVNITEQNFQKLNRTGTKQEQNKNRTRTEQEYSPAGLPLLTVSTKHLCFGGGTADLSLLYLENADCINCSFGNSRSKILIKVEFKCLISALMEKVFQNTIRICPILFNFHQSVQFLSNQNINHLDAKQQLVSSS